MSDIKDRRPGGGGGQGEIVNYRDEGDGSFSESVASLLRGWDTSGLQWVKVLVDSNGKIVSGHGKTLVYITIAQGGATTTTLVTADPNKKVKVVSYAFTLSASGTAKFSDGTVDLTGAYDIAAQGGLVDNGTPQAHILETAAINRPLQIVTTGGAAKGRLCYFLEA